MEIAKSISNFLNYCRNILSLMEAEVGDTPGRVKDCMKDLECRLECLNVCDIKFVLQHISK